MLHIASYQLPRSRREAATCMFIKWVAPDDFPSKSQATYKSKHLILGVQFGFFLEREVNECSSHLRRTSRTLRSRAAHEVGLYFRKKKNLNPVRLLVNLTYSILEMDTIWFSICVNNMFRDAFFWRGQKKPSPTTLKCAYVQNPRQFYSFLKTDYLL